LAVAFVFAISIGTWSGWSGVMPIILKPLGISQVGIAQINVVLFFM